MKKPSERFSYHEKSLPQEGFFVYVLIDPLDNSIFYIGKGKGRRISSHFSKQTLSRKDKKSNKIHSINNKGYKVQARIIINNLSEERSLKYEYRFINYLLRRGFNLANYFTNHEWHLTSENFRGVNSENEREDLAKLLKLKFMYERIDFKELIKQEPFCSSGIPERTMRSWLEYDNSHYDYLVPECPNRRDRMIDDIAHVRVMREMGTSHRVIHEVLNIPYSRSRDYVSDNKVHKFGVYYEVINRMGEIKNGTSKML